MILQQLKLKNFKKYKDKEIRFNEGLIGIVGANGAGKSTIFEAIFFALYGELKTSKNIIKNVDVSEKDEVIVELQFEFENKEYILKREFRGKNLSAKASLYQNGELIVTDVKKVTEFIIKLIKLNKDAFLNTIFASQKELASLSNLKNEDRKKMIRKLLGLEKIDFIEKELNHKISSLKKEIKIANEFVEDNEKIEELKNSIKENQEKLEELKNLKKVDEIKKERFLKSKIEIKGELEVIEDLKARLISVENKIKILETEQGSLNENFTKLLDEKLQLEKIGEELDKLKGVKVKYDTLKEEIKTQDSLKNSFIQWKEKEKLLLELREQYRKVRANISGLNMELEKEKEVLEQKSNMENLLKDIDKNLENLQNEYEDKVSDLKYNRSVLTQTSQQINNIQKLGRESECPTCTRVLGDDYDLVINSLKEIVDTINNKKILPLSKIVENLKIEIDKNRKKKSSFTEEISQLSNQLAVLGNKKEELQKLQIEFDDIKNRGERTKEELQKFENIKYDELKHKSLIKEFDDLKGEYEKVLGLETELKRGETIKNSIDETEKRLKEIDENLKLRKIELDSLKYDDTKHYKLKTDLLKIEGEIDSLNEKLTDIKIDINDKEHQILSLKNRLQKQEEDIEKIVKMEFNLQDYEKIKYSLAGFKRKLNSEIAPRISEKASKMYSLITHGKYQNIRVDNNFDFFIYDDNREYPIERFSGGEIDLANLVLRIAISQTLSELSGVSSIGFLAFDEVFGSQDENRRIEILNAFHLIKEQYRQIFLISHETEIKEMFENLIEV